MEKKKKETVLSILKEIRDALKKPEIVIASAPRQINDRYTDNGNGTITDKELKITIIKDPTALPGFEKTMTWTDAKAACEKLIFAGSTGWRMPTLKEEQSIRDYTRHDPAWDTDIFAGKHDNWYWASTECAWNKDAAWCVYSYSGNVSSIVKGSRNYVRPVRSSQ